ncbi:MAG: hypothetical protein HN888_10175 [Desulfobacula sp.]|nr:hypothetical protein [Desulfobacula sp.]
MKFKLVFFLCVLLIWPFVFVSAEYYHYIDQNGIKHYTDDISKIPENLRPDLNKHKSIISPKEKTVIKKKSMESKAKITPGLLTNKKNELDHEYKILAKKNKSLSEQKNDLDEKEYNALATGLNIEIKHYQKKKERYEELVEQYNKQITK